MAKAKIWGAPNEVEMAKGVIAIFCPGCKSLHHIYTVMPTSSGAKWGFNGDFEKPTFTPSLLIYTGKYVHGHEDYDDEGLGLSSICHSFITDGKIQFLADCTHELKNQTVELPDYDKTCNDEIRN